jgi:hypothetical protein
MSAFVQTTDSSQTSRHVRFVQPKGDIRTSALFGLLDFIGKAVKDVRAAMEYWRLRCL